MKLIALELCGVVAVLVCGLMLGAIAQHRTRRRDEGRYNARSAMEYLWAIVPMLMIAAAVSPAVRFAVITSDKVHNSRRSAHGVANFGAAGNAADLTTEFHASALFAEVNSSAIGQIEQYSSGLISSRQCSDDGAIGPFSCTSIRF